MSIYCHFSNKEYIEVVDKQDFFGYLVLFCCGDKIKKVITKFIAYSEFVNNRKELVKDVDLYLRGSIKYCGLGFLPIFINEQHWIAASKQFKELQGLKYIFKAILEEPDDYHLLETCKELLFKITQEELYFITSVFNKYTICPEYRLPYYIPDNLSFLGKIYVLQLIGKLDQILSIHAQQFLTYMGEEEIRRSTLPNGDIKELLNVNYIKKTYGADLEFNVPKNIDDIIEHFNIDFEQLVAQFEKTTEKINLIAHKFIENKKYYCKFTKQNKSMIVASYFNSIVNRHRLIQIREKKYTDVMFSVIAANDFLCKLIIAHCTNN